MSRDPNVAFEGGIPKFYDQHLGPVIFEPYARDLIERLAPRKPESVLELACGTGIVTRRLQKQLGSDAALVATDLNPAMINVAREKIGEVTNMEWEVADASALPFSNDAFSAVVCQFGVMFVPDKVAVMREAFRVLQPGGVFLFNVWDRMEANPFAKITHKTVTSFFKTDPPKFYELPFGFHNAKVIRKMLTDVGFDAIESSPVELPCRSESANDFAIGLVRGNPIADAIKERGGDVDAVIAAVAKKLAKHGGAEPFESTMRALVWSAEKIPAVNVDATAP